MENYEIKAFEDAIQAYLDKRAESDELFAKVYAKPHKNIHNCCKYIIQEVQKNIDISTHPSSAVFALSDEETFSLAVHYYDEDDIEPTDEDSGMKTCVGTSPKPKKQLRKKKAKDISEQSEDDFAIEIPLFD